MRLASGCVALCLAAVLHSGMASADTQTVRQHARLSYATAPEIERCPSERDVRDAVAARLGYDPFDAVHEDSFSTRDVNIVITKRGKGVVGALDLNPGHREIESPSGDCREVVDALTVAVAIGLDPASLTGPVTPPPPPPQPLVLPEPPPAPPPTAERPAPPPPPPRDAIRMRVGVGPIVTFGELPAPAPGLVVSVSARYKAFEPTIEGLATLGVTQSATVGDVEASLLAATVLPCGRLEYLFACAGLTLGSLHAEGSGTPLRGSEFYSAVSVRGGVELPLGRGFNLRGYAEAIAPITRVTLELASQDVWRMSSVAGRVGASVGVSF